MESSSIDILSKPLNDCKKRSAVVDNRVLENIVISGCGCGKPCLSQLCDGPNNYSQAISILTNCRLELRCMNQTEVINLMVSKLLTFNCTIHSGRRFYDYFIDYHDQNFKLCYKAFALCYGITMYVLKAAKEIILLNSYSNSGKIGDVTKVSNSTTKLFDHGLKNNKINDVERREMVSRCSMSGSDDSLQMYTWMKFYFDLVGDQIPNSNGEIHLEPEDKCEIYQEYCSNVVDNHLSYQSFLAMWDNCFSHVKIREYKQVTGKCMTCFELSALRRTRKDAYGRSQATSLHAFHKTMYMGEKIAYYARAKQAEHDPDNYVSLISDGMAQNHTKLPWLANLKEFSMTVPQHLQGIIDHGNEFVVYRTFHNVIVDSNLAIHCMLMQLEQKLVNGKLPHTIYLQIDGGSENANKYTLSICELLVIRRLCKKVVLTRLPVGHTHENIDGKFALIWVEARNETILTPMKYTEIIKRACGKKGQPVKIHDIFATPNYKQYFEGYIDEFFGNYAKNEHTQLQFIFESTDISNDFPLGSKMTYRAFSCDVVYEIIKSENDIGFEPVRTTVGVFPPQGNWLLRAVPDRPLVPAPFSKEVSNSRASLLKFLSKFKDEFHGSQSAAVIEWEHFVNNCPLSDNSLECQSFMHIPFSGVLFSGTAGVPYRPELVLQQRNEPVNCMEMFDGRPIRNFETTGSVNHHNRGGIMPTRPPPRIEVGAPPRLTGLPVIMSASLRKMSKKDLQNILLERGLPTNGKKIDLIARLEQHN